MKSIKALTPVASNTVPARAGSNLPKAPVQGKVFEGNPSHSPWKGVNHFLEVLFLCVDMTECLDKRLGFRLPLSDVSSDIR